MTDDRKARYREISDGLLRQRRNLLILSLLMPLFFISGADIEKINLFGTIIKIQNPAVIKYAITILFLYFFLRYWQYYKEETYVKDTYRMIHEYLYYWEETYLKRKACEKINYKHQDFFEVYFADPRYSRGFSYVHIPENKDRVIFPFMRECEFYIRPKSSVKNFLREPEEHNKDYINKFHEKMATPEYSNWHPLEPLENSNNSETFYRQYLTYSIIRFHIMRLIGICKYMFNESSFTDYQLPLIVAGCSTLVTVYARFM